MSDAVQVAIVSGVFTLAAVFVSRLWSRSEHKKGLAQSKQTYLLMNSRMEELIEAALAKGMLIGHATGVKEGREAEMLEQQTRDERGSGPL